MACDISRSGVVISITNCYIRFTLLYLLYFNTRDTSEARSTSPSRLLGAYRYVSNPEFEPSLVKNASKACEGICKWVRALDIYDRVIKIVAPKKLKLAEAEAELDVQMQKLNEKRAELQMVRKCE